MLQDFYSNVGAFYECEICHESITNPICPECLTKEIDIWSTNYPRLRRELVPKLKKYLKKLKRQAKEITGCIQCKKSEFSICPFCFARQVLNILEDIEANRIIKKEFLQFFNYGFKDHYIIENEN